MIRKHGDFLVVICGRKNTEKIIHIFTYLVCYTINIFIFLGHRSLHKMCPASFKKVTRILRGSVSVEMFTERVKCLFFRTFGNLDSSSKFRLFLFY